MLQCDVPRNSGLECLGGKKNRGKYILAFPRVGGSTASFHGAFHSSFHKLWDFCREGGHLQITLPKACQLVAHHILASQGVDEADGKGWVSSSGVFFVVFNLFQLCFPSLLCQGISIQV